MDREQISNELERASSSDATHAREVGGNAVHPPEAAVMPAARKVTKSELLWELIDLSEAMPVRHGILGGESIVFVQAPGRLGGGDAGPWMSTQDPRFHRALRALSAEALKRGPGKPIVDEVVAHLEARGYLLEPSPIARRVAGCGGHLWLSLGPAQDMVVKITPEGWSLASDCPVLFLAAENAGTLPIPRRGGSIHALRPYFPNVSEADWPGLLGFMLATFLPSGALPILALSGPKNSGKSVATELIRSVCDPVIGLDARSAFPEKIEDLFTIAASAHVLSFDNLSRITPAISDALCTATTGAARQTRRLFTQGTLHTLRARNPIILNGISTGIEREDLVSRTVFIELQAIGESERLKESTLRRSFQRDLPYILGALLDGVVAALRDGENTSVSPPHRLEDAACFATAAEPVLGLSDGAIVGAWLRSQVSTQDALGDSDPVVEVLGRLIRTLPMWTGTASQLLSQAMALEKQEDGEPLPKDFPRSASQLGDHIRRRKDVLARAGYKVGQHRNKQCRNILIERTGSEVTQAIVAVQRPKAEVKP